jgi:hypothetical protein
LLKFKLGYYQIVTRRLAEFSAQNVAREVHQNEQALARTRLRLSRRPIFDASGKPHFWDRAAYWPVMPDRAPSLGAFFGKARRSPAFQRVHRQERRDLLRGILAGRRVRGHPDRRPRRGTLAFASAD